MQIVEGEIMRQFSIIGFFDDIQDGGLVVAYEFLVILIAEGYLQSSVVQSLYRHSVVLILDQR